MQDGTRRAILHTNGGDMSNLQQMQKQLEELQAAIYSQLAAQTSDDKITALEDAQPSVKFGSPEHATLLESGYGFSIEDAKQIIAERDKDPRVWPFEVYQKAKAMLAAFNVKKPIVYNTKRPWRTRAHSRKTRKV